MKNQKNTTNEVGPIQALRYVMSSNRLAAYIVPSADPHQSEYVPACWRRRAYLSSFTGSAGDLVVTLKHAGLWTDSRYFLQAETELPAADAEITLFKSGLPETPEIGQWLASTLRKGDVVGVDSDLFSRNAFEKLSKTLRAAGLRIQGVEKNLVDSVWQTRPMLPKEVAVPHLETYAGETLANRLTRVREKIATMGGDVLLITTLDALAWLFCIRGTDVEYTPVVIGYGAVEKNRALLFVDPKKVTESLEEHLGPLVEIRPYDAFFSYLVETASADVNVIADPDAVSRRAVEKLKGRCTVLFSQNPVTLLKAVKNPVEIEGITRAHARDGAAMVRFLAWLEAEAPQGSVTEISAAEKLESLRGELPHYRGKSFATISAFGEHGAIVHYESRDQTNCALTQDGIYLIDSGAQYLDGTTDITRTTVIGRPTNEQRDRFTRVLKGHIDLASTSFPVGTTGNRLDTIARKPLWDAGLNYGHGTGHGVGAYLCVHEGPHAVSYYRGMDVPLVDGMILSVEPGYYKATAYGIRIENLVRVVRNEALSSDEGRYLRFETLTLCPIDLRLVEKSLLTRDEIEYLNTYHARVREQISPLVDETSRRWLVNATREI